MRDKENCPFDEDPARVEARLDSLLEATTVPRMATRLLLSLGTIYTGIHNGLAQVPRPC